MGLYFSRVEEFCTHAFAYVYFFSLDDSIFFGRISFPCVLCIVCVCDRITPFPAATAAAVASFPGSHQPFSSFVWLVCLPCCLLLEVIYSSRIYLSACADGGMSVAHGGHSSHYYFFFFFFQREPKGSIGRVVFSSFSISSVQFVSFLFFFFMGVIWTFRHRWVGEYGRKK